MTAKKDQTVEQLPQAAEYRREALLSSQFFGGVQRDFLAAILTEETYTLAAAKAAVAGVLGGMK